MKQQAREIILIGGSAGSYGLIIEILINLPQLFSSAICVIIHRNASFETQIEESLSKKLGKDIISIRDKQDILKNGIYFAPPGYHLLIEPDISFALDASEPVKYAKPSIDVLYKSTAEIFGENCTAFLLSGANSDGALGVKAILEQGGKVFIQDPEEALIATMPTEAILLNPDAQVMKQKDILSYFENLR